jgi:inhibitor of cysteine peptidase
MEKRKNYIIILLGVFILILSGCSNLEINKEIINNEKLETEQNQSTNIELKVIKNNNDYLKIINEEISNTISTYHRDSTFEGGGVLYEKTNSLVNVDATFSGTFSDDYSKTNVQEENIDEADIVKTDGKYIYTLKEKELFIVDVYPPNNMKITSGFKLNENDENSNINPKNIFINGDYLILFANEYKRDIKISEISLLPYETYRDYTKIMIFNISNREKLELIEEFSITGSYHEARMLNNNIYLVSKENNYFYGPDFPFPILYRNEEKILNSQVYYYDIKENMQINNIFSFSLDNLEDYTIESFLLDSYSSTLYMSEKNLYISAKNNYQINEIKQFEEVILPIINDTKIQEEIKNILNNNRDNQEIKKLLDEHLNSLDVEDRIIFSELVYERLYNYQDMMESENSKTAIFKFEIDDTQIKLIENTLINGELVNQFSLSEKDENLRVATTTSYWSRSNGLISYNNVYVLDKNLNEIGKIEGLADGEQIYSTRFLGDILFMVTFKEIDPLFVINLSNPENPKVLGYLKIPGFSEYLHPYKENYLLGIGKDTTLSEWGGVITNGVKISLFDVKDLNNPKEVDNYIIKGRYTQTEVSEDHKALLLDEKRDYLVLPIREELRISPEITDIYTQNYFLGAYVFDLSNNKIERITRIEHKAEFTGRTYYSHSPDAIKRALYIDDTLYTISENKILASNISENFKKVNEINIE